MKQWKSSKSKMEIEILSRRYNELLKRTEVRFKIVHPSSPSPTRLEVRKELASKLECDSNLLFIIRMVTRTGMNETVGEAEVYDSLKEAEEFVPEHIRLGHKAPEEKAKEKPKEKVKEKPKS